MSLPIDSLFRLHRQELVNWLMRFLSCRETAKDLVQESFLILTRVSAQQTIAEPRAFLYRTAKNLTMDHLRRHKISADYARTAAMRYEGADPCRPFVVSGRRSRTQVPGTRFSVRTGDTGDILTVAEAGWSFRALANPMRAGLYTPVNEPAPTATC